MDGVIELKAFDAATKESGGFKDHHGFLQVVKSPRFNSLSWEQQQSLGGAAGGKFVFKSLRTKLSVERIHLPPALGEEEKEKKKTKADLEF